ncbi:Prophage antirepressor [Fructobacillus evanidus]|uniref:ORF6C domain-containing protein n=1 Tax=Fructobacillus evanidus TaxID=3064281 RepID=UPI002D95D49C|nr:Prophage antirepressor [Fructobacillus sp. LMG 32999]
MANEVKAFNFESNEVRTVLIDNEPWFVGKDVATTLGYKRTADAISSHVDEDDKLGRRFTDSGQTREMVMINESGVYALIFGSKLNSAKRFKKWVTSEVLPSIRKTGSYSVQKDPMAILATTFEALKQQEDKQNQLEQRLDKFEDDQEIRSWEQSELLQLRRNRVFAILGGKYSQAYKELSSEVFHAIAKDFKQQFSVPRYNALPRKYFEDGKRFLINWEPNNLLELAIRGANQEQTA